MTDWSKLKVNDLKAELKKRNLLTTGVKAVLIERLQAADRPEESESENTIQGDATKLDADSATSPDEVSPILPTPADSLPLAPPSPETKTNDDAALEPLKSAAPEEIAEDTTGETSSMNLATTVEAPQVQTDLHTSALPSVEPQEANEDRLKRKQRSQSPPITNADSANKRIRLSNDVDMEKEEVATTTQDAKWVEEHNGVDETAANKDMMEVAPATDAMDRNDVDGSGANEDAMEEAPTTDAMDGTTFVNTTLQDASPDEYEHKGDDMEIDTPAKEDRKPSIAFEDSPSRARDSRYKTLFAGEGPTPTVPETHDDGEPDRIIAPAFHPATSALYISHLMRPINPGQFQNHLAALATPPGSEIDAGAVLNFYLDPIRTHALATFPSVSAASRVRSALHDRIWPDEKTRKPLWVDFVPIEKVDEWIDIENASNPGGRASGKKWEVAYDVDHDGRVTTSLREPSGSSGPMMHPARQASISGAQFQAAPQQPRTFAPPSGPRAHLAGPLSVPGTSRLDQLFKSTTAKPMVYWNPVAKEVVNQRLDNIDRALSKDAVDGYKISGEIHRYSFEDSVNLVTRGPEIFSGIRPPRGGGGGRGGSRGGYQGGRGRGGYGMRDTFRPSGGEYRNDGGYRGDRREYRDHGRY